MQTELTAVLVIAVIATASTLIMAGTPSPPPLDPAPEGLPVTEAEHATAHLDAGSQRLDAPKTTAARRSGRPRTVEQAINEDVRRLTRLLDLDERQRLRLRQILESRNSRMRSVWKDNPNPEADRIGPTMAIMERTREEIRAILTDEQRVKYPAAVPRDQLGPATADLDHWLRLTHPNESNSGAPAN